MQPNNKLFSSLHWAMSPKALPHYLELLSLGLDEDVAFAVLEREFGEDLYDLPPSQDPYPDTDGAT